MARPHPCFSPPSSSKSGIPASSSWAVHAPPPRHHPLSCPAWIKHPSSCAAMVYINELRAHVAYPEAYMRQAVVVR
uniref:Uncharacterized protein n=1 Tax=Oryza meridionalis TaxID=40149 RepID=A0A0E0D1L4_9ORYZ